MAKSLPPVSAKVIADAEQFIAEFKRADNAARRSSASIDKEVGTLTKKLGDKFKLADFGKDVLKGAGLFGGFDIARTTAEAIAGFWEKAAESAKAIEESTNKALEATMKTIAARQTDAQKEAALLAQFERKGRELEEAKRTRFTKTPVWGVNGVTMQQVEAPRTGDQEAAIHQLDAEYKALGAQVEEFQRKQRDTTAADQQASALEAVSIAGDMTSRKITAMADSQEVANQRFKEWVELTDENTPLKKFEDQIERINFLMRENATILGDAAAEEAAWKAKVKVWADIAEDVEKRHPQKTSTHAEMKEIGADELRAADELLHKMDANAQEIERIVGRAADGMADAWVDSLKGVEGAWSNLADSIITEIMRVVAQILIVKPIINGLGGIISGFGGGAGSAIGAAFSAYGGGKASGGGVEAGYTYRVNEQGQEFFRPSVGGAVMPVGASGGASGGGGSGDTFNFGPYHFGSGVQRAEILPMLSLWQRDTLAKIADAKRRRSSLGAALA